MFSVGTLDSIAAILVQVHLLEHIWAVCWQKLISGTVSVFSDLCFISFLFFHNILLKPKDKTNLALLKY